jgi:hypothetical protein
MPVQYKPDGLLGEERITVAPASGLPFFVTKTKQGYVFG